MANAATVRERGTDGVEFVINTPASQPGDVFPAGVILNYAGPTPPTGWLICDGSVVARATYPSLFSAIGTTFGAGDGSTTFGIPDSRGKVLVGKHSSGTFNTLGATGGEETHVLSAGEMPVHTHTVSVSGSTDSQGSHTHTGTLPQDILLNGYDNNVSDNTNRASGAVGTVHTNSPALSINAAGSHAHNVSASGTTASAGSGSSHNNLQPYIVFNHIIRAY